jgi:hypothetical protein
VTAMALNSLVIKPLKSQEPRTRVPGVRFFLHCTAYGVPFQLIASDELLLAEMHEALPFGTEVVAVPSRGAASFTVVSRIDRTGFWLYAGAVEILDREELAPVLRTLGHELMLHVGVHAPERIFLHAGVVGWCNRAILLPGFSCAGKTTLVAELVRAGATYYSDDYALIDARGMVHPYARDLQMRRPGKREQERVTVEDLHGKTGTTPVPVAHVVFTEFMESAQWSPEPLTPGLALLEMLRHTLPVKQRPGEVLATLGSMMRTAQAWRSKRGEAVFTAESLLSAWVS